MNLKLLTSAYIIKTRWNFELIFVFDEPVAFAVFTKLKMGVTGAKNSLQTRCIFLTQLQRINNRLHSGQGDEPERQQSHKVDESN